MENIDRKYKLWRIKIFAVTWITYAGFYLCRKNFAVVKSPLKTEFGFDNLQLGLIDTAYLTTYAIGAFLNGVLGDRFGAKVTVGVGLVVVVITNYLFGYGSVLGFLMMLYGINGYAQATGWPGLVKTMANWFSVHERGIVMGWWGSCFEIGSAIATAVATWSLAHWGWRYSFFVPALLLTGITLLFFIFQKDHPEDVDLPDIETYRREDKNILEEKNGRLPFKTVLRDVLSSSTVWICGASYFCLKLVRYALMFWLPLYMVERLGYKPDQAGYHSIIVEVGGFLGGLVAGYVSDKLFDSRRGPIAALMLFGLGLSIYAHTYLTLMGPLMNAVGMALVGFMIYGPDSILTGAAAMDFGTKEGASTAAGFINGMGSTGAALQGLIVGYVSQKFGWNYLFYLFIGLSFIAGSLTSLLWNVEAPHKKVNP